MGAYETLAASLNSAADGVEALSVSLAARLAACHKMRGSLSDSLDDKKHAKPKDLGTILLPGGDPTYLIMFQRGGRPTEGVVGEPNGTWTDPTSGIEWHLDSEGRPSFPVPK